MSPSASQPITVEVAYVFVYGLLLFFDLVDHWHELSQKSSPSVLDRTNAYVYAKDNVQGVPNVNSIIPSDHTV